MADILLKTSMLLFTKIIVVFPDQLMMAYIYSVGNVESVNSHWELNLSKQIIEDFEMQQKNSQFLFRRILWYPIYKPERVHADVIAITFYAPS